MKMIGRLNSKYAQRLEDLKLCHLINSIKFSILSAFCLYKKRYKQKAESIENFMKLIWFLFFFSAVIPAFSRHTSVPVVKGWGGGCICAKSSLYLSYFANSRDCFFCEKKTKSSLKRKIPAGNKYRENFKREDPLI